MFGELNSREFLVFISSILFIGMGIIIQRFFNKKHEDLSPVSKITPAVAIKKSGLSKQEYKVLGLVAEGLSNQQIAERLFIQESTVKSHVSNILLKLQAKRRTEAVKIAREMQLI